MPHICLQYSIRAPTSDIMPHIWYMHCITASLVPDTVTARSVELGSISLATCIVIGWLHSRCCSLIGPLCWTASHLHCDWLTAHRRRCMLFDRHCRPCFRYVGHKTLQYDRAMTQYWWIPWTIATHKKTNQTKLYPRGGGNTKVAQACNLCGNLAPW
jgi:hypothetical protein